MMKNCLHILLIITVAACAGRRAAAPVWQNKMPVVALPGDSLVFAAAGKKWTASLLSVTQPLPLHIRYTGTGFVLRLKNQAGIAEGPAQLLLSRGRQQYLYELHLLNTATGTVTGRDYRSPKTVNPDSALTQQSMLHRIDEWRNLLLLPLQQEYFSETLLRLPPAAGSFRAQQGQPLSAFYVQPGSAVSVPVTAVYNHTDRAFAVTAGPLRDVYGNTVADGTLVAFMYQQQSSHWRMEAAAVNGRATVQIPAMQASGTVTVKINETASAPLRLIIP